MVRLLFAICALSIAARGAPVAIDSNIDGEKQISISDDSFEAQVVPQAQSSSTEPLSKRAQYWIDEFDNLIEYDTSSTPSTKDRRRSAIPVVSDSPAEEQSKFESSFSSSQEQSIEDVGNNFYRAHIAGYMDLMSSFGPNLDLDQEYIQGFSVGVSILVFVVLGVIVAYFVALPAAQAAWKKAAPPLRSLGHRRSMSKYSM